jgi:hypothetical protein
VHYQPIVRFAGEATVAVEALACWQHPLVGRVAPATEGVGALEETLKWGQPAYLTRASRSGSTIRIGCRRADPHTYAMYFHCQTDLVHRFRALFTIRLHRGRPDLQPDPQLR